MARSLNKKDQSKIFFFYSYVYARLDFNKDKHIGIFTGLTIALGQISKGEYPSELPIQEVNSDAKKAVYIGYYSFANVQEMFNKPDKDFVEFVELLTIELLE